MDEYRNYLDSVLLNDTTTTLETVCGNIFANLRTCFLGRVKAVNDDYTIDVQPVVRDRTISITGIIYRAAPLLRRIPYIYNAYEPQEGDYCVCFTLDRSIAPIITATDKFIQTLETINDTGTNKHSINDCVAIVGLFKGVDKKNESKDEDTTT